MRTRLVWAPIHTVYHSSVPTFASWLYMQYMRNASHRFHRVQIRSSVVPNGPQVASLWILNGNTSLHQSLHQLRWQHLDKCPLAERDGTAVRSTVHCCSNCWSKSHDLRYVVINQCITQCMPRLKTRMRLMDLLCTGGAHVAVTDWSRLACNRYDRLVASDHLTSTYGLYKLQSLQMSILLTFAMSP